MLKDRMFYTTSEDVIGGIISRDNNGTKYWYHTDRLGNVMAITDSNGAAYAVYTMDAWGNVLEKGLGSGYSSEHGTDPQPYHLTTKEYDPDSGLYYFNARWYDPTAGRFLGRDPGVPFMRFSFCANNPVGVADPTGMWGKSVHLTGSAAECNRVFSNWDWKYNCGDSQQASICDAVAAADQGLDECSETEPYGHPQYHIPAARDYWSLRNGFRNNAYKNCDTSAFGKYLHMAQDEYSHSGLPDPGILGGVFTGACHEGRRADSTFMHHGKSLRTLSRTYDLIKAFLDECACDLCAGEC